MNATVHHPRGRLDGAPNPIDAHIGRRVKLRRTLLGMTQEKLGARLGLTFQQVQKYERGANRLAGSRLYDIAQALDVPVGFFFDDMPDGAASPARLAGAATPARPGPGADPLRDTDALEILRDFRRIEPEQQAVVRALIASMATRRHVRMAAE